MTRGAVWRSRALALAASLGAFGLPGDASAQSPSSAQDTGVQDTRAQDAACEPRKAAQKYPTYADKVVKIGVNSTYPPFSYNDAGDMKKLVGLDVEIVEHAMRCAGLKFEYVNGAHSGLYPTLFSGYLDVMIGNIFYRPDRADKAGFVLYMVNGQSLVVGKGNPSGIRSADGMCGHAASGPFTGSSALLVQDIGKRCLEAGKAELAWVPAADPESAYRSLANGRVDMVMDGTASAALRMSSAEGKVFEVAFTLLTDVKSGVMAPKGNRDMLKVIADGLSDLQATGRLATLMKTYGLQEDWLIPVEVRP